MVVAAVIVLNKAALVAQIWPKQRRKTEGRGHQNRVVGALASARVQAGDGTEHPWRQRGRRVEKRAREHEEGEGEPDAWEGAGL